METVYCFEINYMKKELFHIVDYLVSVAVDPFPRYILKKEILLETPNTADIEAIRTSKWYTQLLSEQWENGSWGRFHTQDTKTTVKQKFVTTEAALSRAYELRLDKDDPMITKCIEIMESYIRGDETWTDNVEKHNDNGRGHMYARPYMTAARLNMFDPENLVIKPLKDEVVQALESSFVSGIYNEDLLLNKIHSYLVPGLSIPGNYYGSLLLQNSDCMNEKLQRFWLDYIWNKKDGIYYASSIPPKEKQNLESNLFRQWFSTLELLSGFKLFSEYVINEIYPHLLGETDKLLKDKITLPKAHPINNRYSEKNKDKNAQKNDLLLRILRLLVKC